MYYLNVYIYAPEFHDQFFLACECNVDGSVDTKCSTPEGKCTCNDGVGGDKCDVCKTEHFGFPTCESMNFQ